MIHRNPNGNQMQRNARPQRNGLPFLSAQDVTDSRQPAVIIAARVGPDSFRAGQQVVSMRISYKGQHWQYNLRTSNPNLDLLCQHWGDDETTWKGKELNIYLEEDQISATKWVRLEPSTVPEENYGEETPVAPKTKRGK